MIEKIRTSELALEEYCYAMRERPIPQFFRDRGRLAQTTIVLYHNKSALSIGLCTNSSVFCDKACTVRTPSLQTDNFHLGITPMFPGFAPNRLCVFKEEHQKEEYRKLRGGRVVFYKTPRPRTIRCASEALIFVHSSEDGIIRILRVKAQDFNNR